MNDIRLFEIVVYPESEDMYYEKWESIKESFIEHQIYTGNVTYDEGLETFKRAFSDVYLWNYNKLYGFIVINYNYKTGDIYFEIYKQTHNIYNKKVTLRLTKEFGPNLHVYIKNKTNGEIIKLIDSKLEYIKNTFFKKYYLDLVSYNSLKSYVNFKELINKDSD